ncbi:S41 family peptidase [Peijinzhouia sedimentorum]
MRATTKKIAAGLLISTGILYFSFSDPGEKYFQIAKNLDIFATLYKEVNQFYVDDVNPSKLMNIGINSMLMSLDPYTNYYPEEEIEDYRTMTTNEYAGVGMLVGTHDDKNIVIMPHKGFSAASAGIRIGDEILSVNDIDVKGKSNDEISQLLKGQVKSDVKITVKRFGENAPLDFMLKREKVTIPNVPFYGMVNQEVAYIKLSDFTTNASKEVKDALIELKEKGAKKLILDLRDNPGGLLSEAVNISNLFLPKGAEIVSTKGKIDDWNKTYYGLNQPVDLDIPIAVLTSGRSASASEIVAGAIQDYDRGILVGQKTFGKGLVQATRPLSYNSQLKITTAKYYIPSGRCIQAIDYANNQAVKLPDSLKVAFTTQNGRIVYDGAGIDPDVPVIQEEIPSIILGLDQQNMIFDFATEYQKNLPAITSPEDFEVTDEIYNAFIDWLNDKDFDYTTRMESSIKVLEDIAKEEQYYSGVKGELDQLAKKVMHNKDQDLQTFKPDIKKMLKVELVSRQLFKEGQIRASFQEDEDVQMALNVLKETSRYNSILKQQ